MLQIAARPHNRSHQGKRKPCRAPGKPAGTWHQHWPLCVTLLAPPGGPTPGKASSTLRAVAACQLLAAAIQTAGPPVLLPRRRPPHNAPLELG